MLSFFSVVLFSLHMSDLLFFLFFVFFLFWQFFMYMKYRNHTFQKGHPLKSAATYVKAYNAESKAHVLGLEVEHLCFMYRLCLFLLSWCTRCSTEIQKFTMCKRSNLRVSTCKFIQVSEWTIFKYSSIPPSLTLPC